MNIDNLKGLYVAHRGIHNSKIPENTIPAISLALERKIPIELDINILKDKNIIVFHDYTLKRLIGINKKIYSCTYNELKKITFPNTDIHIPLLEEVLDLVKGKVLLIIEIKNNKIYSYKEYCQKIVSILDNYNFDFAIQSFDIRIVNWFLKNTNYTTGLLIADLKHLLTDLIKSKKLIRNNIKPHFLSVDYHLATKKIVINFRKKSPVLVWTIKDIETLKQVKESADSYLIDSSLTTKLTKKY